MKIKLLSILFLCSVIAQAQNCSDTINHPPKAYFHHFVSVPTCGGCGSGVNIFSDSSASAPGNPVVAWNWSFPGASPSSSTMQHPFGINYPQVGNYTVCLTVTASNGCKDSTCKVIYNICTSVNEIDIESLVKVFPNPTNGKVNMQMGKSENVQMSIYNIYGECIHQQISAPANPQIDLGSRPNGVYFLKLNTPDGVVVKKIVKE